MLTENNMENGGGGGIERLVPFSENGVCVAKKARINCVYFEKSSS